MARFTIIKNFRPDSHAYFREEGTGRVALADSSGDTPEDTDDGVLYLDQSRPLRIGAFGFLVPLRRESGEPCGTGATATAARFMIEHCGMELDVAGLRLGRPVSAR